MKASNSLRRQLERTDDETLRRLILTVANAAGLDKSRAESIASDIPGLRRRLETMDDREFSELAASLGSGKASEVMKRLGLG